ncbi:3'-5' exoribonuclease [Clostridium cavendishii DSM 21758]|uniref:3'-5' exoribonuclease n=1 Tax=Clostridium cavendishii DSM 21758 TaxID=1121302 RepID=A0A1M6SSH5_9CLOT|nr:HD domain-containing protein [Clostridium cavendishii]SHK47606.1 3'-5' exoribonuclease [Clostridium cavendishii DSM 21758]
MSIVNKKISEFSQGDKIEGFYLIKSVECKTANANGKRYLDFTLGDSTGEITAKVWEVNKSNENAYKKNTIIKVKGLVNAWQNALQLKIEDMRNIEDEDNIKIEDYVQSAPYDSGFMFEYINDYIEGIKSIDIKNIVNEIFNDNKEKLMYYPAAKKNHHSIRGGLLYHIMTMISVAEKLCEIYTFLNKDLVYAGVILHDLAKIKEMDSNELGIVNEYTLEGTLLGHITQGIKELEIVGKKVNADKEVIILLQHMILSHHYEPEYGSPIKPMIPEAEMLHYLDIMDARMYDMLKITKETQVGQFSERLWSLENRRIYKHKFNEKI